MPSSKNLRLALVVTALIAACGGGDDTIEVTSGTVLLNATVVNTRDGAQSEPMSIIIDAGKIQKITPNRAIRITGSAQAINAAGKYVVPGYLDMHTHSLDSAALSTTNWPLQIANGITGVREMGGAPNAIALARQLNIDSAAGRVDAPEILMTAGEILAGIVSGPQAAAAVAARKDAGADFIKAVAANRDGMLGILSAATTQGLSVAGHLTPTVSALESSNAGMKAIEHLGSGMGSLLDCSADEASIRQSILAGPGPTPPVIPSWAANTANAPNFQRVFDTYSGDKCLALVNAFVRNGTWHVPTLYRLLGLQTADDAAFAADPNLIYVPADVRASWAGIAAGFAAIPAAGRDSLRQYYGLQKTLTKLMKLNGVKMLAGSDTARIAVWMIPGFSLHKEFRELAAAGLSPLEILQMTTLNGAEFLGRQTTMGTVDEGKNADLVLLDANPIADVANLSRISAVVLKGKHFSKDALDAMKGAAASGIARQLPNAHGADAPDHVD